MRVAGLGLVVLVATALLPLGVDGAELTLTPADTEIRFALGSTLHRVEGRARLASGTLRFDPEGGPASGRIVIDATSAETGNRLRDGQMHGQVLESERYPTIELVPASLEVDAEPSGDAEVVLVGTLRIHGSEHPLRVPARVERRGDALRIVGSFVIPYVAWGLRDVSNFLLSVDPEVEVSFEARATLLP